MVVAMCAAVVLLTAALCGDSDTEEILWLSLGILVYVTFCCTLSRTVRALWDSPRARILSLLILLALMLLPLLSFLFEDRFVDLPPIAWINPIAAAIAYGDHPSAPNDLFGRQCYMWFYIFAASVAFMVRKFHRQRIAAARPAAQQS